MSIFYVDGAYVPAEEAVIPANDLAILRGFGAFDFLRTYGGHPFRLDKNIARLRNSCDLIGLAFPWSNEEVDEIVTATLHRNAGTADEFNIRLVVTGGSSSDNITPDGTPRLMVMVTPLHRLPDAWYRDGVKVVTVDMERLIPGAKSTNYMSAILAQAQARKADGIEALYRMDDGRITEGTTTNIFAFYGNTLVTPQIEMLPGITRQTVLELAEEHYTIEQRDLTYDELLRADETFITAANKQVVPVVQIDEHSIGDGRPGEGTQHIMMLFRELTEQRATGVPV